MAFYGIYTPYCFSETCVKRRESPNYKVPISGELYKDLNWCISCGTNFIKPISKCPCCKYPLRTSPKKKRNTIDTHVRY